MKRNHVHFLVLYLQVNPLCSQYISISNYPLCANLCFHESLFVLVRAFICIICILYIYNEKHLRMLSIMSQVGTTIFIILRIFYDQITVYYIFRFRSLQLITCNYTISTYNSNTIFVNYFVQKSLELTLVVYSGPFYIIFRVTYLRISFMRRGRMGYGNQPNSFQKRRRYVIFTGSWRDYISL